MKHCIAPKIFFVILAASLALQPVGFASGGLHANTAAHVNKANAKAVFARVLKLGSTGQDVQAMQKKLKELGFFSASPTILFGSVTYKAVKTFQKAKGLASDGVVGRTTFNAIYAKGGSSGNTTPPPATTTPPTADNGKYGRMQNQTMLTRGNSGQDVCDLQRALKQKGFFNGSITGKFESQTEAAVMRFQQSVCLPSDGKAGNYTLSALYTLLNPPDLNTITPWPDKASEWAALTVEKLTWATASTGVLKKGTDAVVVDVKSGYAFTIKRTGGSLHADVETISPLDTATFYKAIGKFSWARRAIWVIVNGHRLAASMNCMPHGYDSLPGNDFKGQFCIHFVGSRTHGTNRVDPDHQKAIEVAFTTPMVVPGATQPPVTTLPTAAPDNDGSGGDQLPPI